MALIASVGATAIINSFTTTEPTSAVTVLDSNTDLADTAINSSLSKSESVYVIANPDGTTNQTFIGNTLSTSAEPLPLSLKITHSLDGTEINPADLIGKSGHVKLTYTFTATKSYQNKLVPFLTVTGLSLDSSKFTNITIDHGKIVSENDSTILAGYTFAGLAEDLGTDLLPNQFSVEADVTNFELADTYTFATNELFADFDTTKLTSIDSIVNSINDLAAGLDQILAGSAELAKGSTDLATGASKLSAGVNELSEGASQLSAGIDLLDAKVTEFTPKLQSLATGLSTLSGKSTAVNQGVQAAFTGLLNNLQQIAGSTDPQTAAALGQIITYYSSNVLPDLYQSLGTYTGTVDYIASSTANLDLTELTNGVSALKSGANELATGTDQLATGANELATGASQLASGASTLNDGLNTFKQQGINKLVDFANRNLTSFTSNLRSTVSAAKSYHHYTNENATSVKFIFKTLSLK